MPPSWIARVRRVCSAATYSVSFGKHTYVITFFATRSDIARQVPSKVVIFYIFFHCDEGAPNTQYIRHVTLALAQPKLRPCRHGSEWLHAWQDRVMQTRLLVAGGVAIFLVGCLFGVSTVYLTRLRGLDLPSQSTHALAPPLAVRSGFECGRNWVPRIFKSRSLYFSEYLEDCSSVAMA